ncbi:MAG TPA: YkgJ family cysteine cluster protein [Steroidobacteraceae bacterium]|nr:YkgJ family cysteine cluster protein [Steroidobacteraceae bacterium]
MDLHFGCTQCGKCCRDLKLPLTVAEAIAWLARGSQVQLICEAVPWPVEPAPDDQKAAHRRRRSFAAFSGTLPTRVSVILAANLVGACPNLMADQRCGIYERRPLVCRIYPVEINPFIALDPANKACPPEAWTADQRLIQRDGRVVDERMRRDIQQSRDSDALDVEVKRRLCAALQVNCAALVDDGFVVHSPECAALLAALRHAVDERDPSAMSEWRFISNRSDTIASLQTRGAVAGLVRAGEAMPFEYIGFQ